MYYLFINDEYNGFTVEEFDTIEAVTTYIENDNELEAFTPVSEPNGLMDVNTYCIFKGRACKVKRSVEVVEC